MMARKEARTSFVQGTRDGTDIESEQEATEGREQETWYQHDDRARRSDQLLKVRDAEAGRSGGGDRRARDAAVDDVVVVQRLHIGRIG